MRLILLVLVVLGSGCDARQRALEEQKKAEVMHIEAEKAALEAHKRAAEARKAVEDLQKELDEVDAKVTKAVDDVASAENEAQRNAAVARLQNLRAERQAIATRTADAKAAAERAERVKGVKISKECIDNPLAKGCS
jgi:hypothetical protein